MSYQFREQITINGEQYETECEPLKVYEEEINKKWQGKNRLTSLWRGYVGTWDLDFGRLFLTNLKVPNDSSESPLKEVSYESIFDTTDRVFAYWFSGEIMIPKGAIIMSYFHQDIYQTSSYYIFKHGILVEHYDKDNTKQNWEPEPW